MLLLYSYVKEAPQLPRDVPAEAVSAADAPDVMENVRARTRQILKIVFVRFFIIPLVTESLHFYHSHFKFISNF